MPTLDGRVRALASEGDSVVETERGLVFAPGGVPGDRVRLEDVQKTGKILRARRLVVLEPSPERVESACPHHERCGGCPWITASAAAQLEAKRAFVERALARIPRASPSHSTITITSAARLAYRGRARLAWKRTGAGLALGFRARRGDRVADVDRCAVLRPALDATLALARARLGPVLQGGGELHLALGAGGKGVIAIETPDPQPRELFAALEAVVAEGAIAGASVRAGGASVATITGDAREHGADVEGRALVGPVAGFSQAHEEINAALGARVLALAEPRGQRVLELHAGHGNLTLALASRAAQVRAVELARPATDALRTNLEAHHLHAEVITADASSAIPRKGSFDVVVLDPPRTGAKDAMAAIARLRPARVVYVSCDPATLGRDLALLDAYALDAAEAFDMFPQTPHVETVARMIRVDRG